MKIEETSLKGVFLIHFDPIYDNRGYFLRFWDESVLSQFNIPLKWCEESISYSRSKNTVRGLHFQYEPFSQAKMIILLKGHISDVAVNIDINSPDYGKWQMIELSDKYHSALYIPANFAHGFVTRADDCYLIYKMNKPYNPQYEDGIIWKDKELGITWNVNNPILSERDKGFKTFKEISKFLKGLNNEQQTGY